MIAKAKPDIYVPEWLNGVFDGLNGLVGLFNSVLMISDPAFLAVWTDVRREPCQRNSIKRLLLWSRRAEKNTSDSIGDSRRRSKASVFSPTREEVNGAGSVFGIARTQVFTDEFDEGPISDIPLRLEVDNNVRRSSGSDTVVPAASHSRVASKEGFDNAPFSDDKLSPTRYPTYDSAPPVRALKPNRFTRFRRPSIPLSDNLEDEAPPVRGFDDDSNLVHSNEQDVSHNLPITTQTIARNPLEILVNVEVSRYEVVRMSEIEQVEDWLSGL